jgi:hypothetical protein
MSLFFRKEVEFSKKHYDELDERVWNLEQKINSALHLLGVGFSGINSNTAVFIEKRKDKK